MDSNGRPWSIFIECAFLISNIATIVNEHIHLVAIIMLFKSYACSMLGIVLFSRTIGYEMLQFSVPFVVYRFGFVCPFSFVYDYFPVFPCMLMIKIILSEKKEKRIKSWSAKLDTISVRFSVSCCSLCVPPCHRSIQLTKWWEAIQCAGPGHRLHTQTIKLFRKGREKERDSFWAKIIEIIC